VTSNVDDDDVDDDDDDDDPQVNEMDIEDSNDEDEDDDINKQSSTYSSENDEEEKSEVVTCLFYISLYNYLNLPPPSTPSLHVFMWVVLIRSNYVLHPHNLQLFTGREEGNTQKHFMKHN